MLSRLLFCLILPLLPLTASAEPTEIVLGQVAPFSGPLAPTGKAYRNGIQLYLDVVNAGGGVAGSTLRLVSVDDEYKPEQTVKLARDMLRDVKPIALVGAVGTSNAMALIKEKVLDESSTPLIGVRSGASSVIAANNAHIFIARASYADEIASIVELYSQTGTSRYAVFYQNDGFGQDGLASAERLIAQHKGQILASGSYERNTTDVAKAVKTIAAASPQTVIMVSNTAASAEFIKQMREAGNVSQLVALSVTDGLQVVEKIGPAVAKGLAITQVVPAPNNTNIPLIKEILAAHKRFATPDTPLNHTVVEGYLAAKVLVEGLRKAGKNPTRKQLRDTLRGFKNVDMGGVAAHFGEAGRSGIKYVDITILNKEGKLLR